MLHKKNIFINFLLIFTFLTASFIKSEIYFQEFLQKDICIDLPEKYKDKEDISCLIADIKYDGNTVKILELGNVISSTLSSHESIWGEDIIWKRFYDYLEKLNCKLFCIGRPKEPEDATFIAFEKLHTFGALRFDTIEQLAKQQIIFNNYQGLLTFQDHSPTLKKYKSLEEKFPGFLVLNNIAHYFATNKFKTCLLFHNKELSKFRPRWKIYPKKYSKSIVQKIKNDFESDVLVIKPINSTLGRGVIIINKEDLDETLQTIFTKPEKIKYLRDESYSYWAEDSNIIFLVESCEKSKLLTIENKKYEAKMRVAFVLSCKDGKINLKFLGSYWKAAYRPIDAIGTLTEKYKSKSGDSNKSIKVSCEDTKQVQEILSHVLPKMYIQMMEIKENVDHRFPSLKKALHF